MLKLLNEKFKLNLSEAQLEDYAAQLGADCPFFIKNQPVFAKGTGNLFEPLELSLRDTTSFWSSQTYSSLPAKPLPTFIPMLRHVH